MRAAPTLLLLLPLALTHPAAGRSISAAEARKVLRETGRLAEVTIEEPFDLSKVASPGAPRVTERPWLALDRVVFAGGLFASTRTVEAGLHLRGSTLRSVEVAGTEWLGGLWIEETDIETSADFRRNVFRGEVRFHFARFGDEAWFSESRFAAPSEFLQCSWDQDVRFSGAVFSAAVRFNDSVARGRAVFQATVFEDDAGFVEFAADNALFLNTLFKGDAEFRYCRFETARFGSREHLSVFYGLADFRGCRMGSARFDYVETRGAASFVKAEFGTGGASFANASFAGPLTNLDGVSSEGPLDLSDAYLPNLRFRWSEIEQPVLAAAPSAAVVQELAAQLTQLGRHREALAAEYDIARLSNQETWEDSSRGAGERLLAKLEWIVWGWPTGYGTKLGRIVLIAAIAWPVLSLPSMTRRGLIVDGSARDLPVADPGRETTRRPRHRSSYWWELPPGSLSPWRLRGRLSLALAFTFGLLFKVGARELTYVELERRGGRHRFERYFLFVWILGSVVVALMALTLAKSSPVISKIVGDILL